MNRKQVCKVFAARLKEMAGDRIGMQMYRDLGLKLSRQYHWKNGAHLPQVTELVALTKYLGCSADYLLGLSDEI